MQQEDISLIFCDMEKAYSSIYQDNLLWQILGKANVKQLYKLLKNI
jgi:hypothetical protein